MTEDEMQSRFDKQDRKIAALEEALRRIIDAVLVLSETTPLEKETTRC